MFRIQAGRHRSGRNALLYLAGCPHPYPSKAADHKHESRSKTCPQLPDMQFLPEKGSQNPLQQLLDSMSVV